MVPLQNEGRHGGRAGFFDGDGEGGSANGALKRSIAGVAQNGGRRADRQAAGRGGGFGFACHAQQEHRSAGERGAALQAAGFLQPEATRIATQFENEAGKRAACRGLLGDPQCIFGAFGCGGEELPGAQAGKARNAGQIGDAGLVRRCRRCQPKQWHVFCFIRCPGPIHQAQRKTGQAGDVAGLRAAQFGQRRFLQTATKRDVEGRDAGLDQVQVRMDGLPVLIGVHQSRSLRRMQGRIFCCRRMIAR